MKVELTRITLRPEMAIAEAAASCYDSIPSIDVVEKCYRSGHLAVFEFLDFTFHVEGVSRALTHQLVRKRMASYAQRSQRYVNENMFGYVIPKSVSESPTAMAAFLQAMNTDQLAYDAMVKVGIPKEDARFVLPNACETVINIHMNMHSMIDFCGERLCNRAQWEIREMVTRMVFLVGEQAPLLAKYLVPKCERHAPYNFCVELKSCGRHPKLSDIYPKELIKEESDVHSKATRPVSPVGDSTITT